MDLYFNQDLTCRYKSRSQVARVLTEEWVNSNMYCPRCGCVKLIKFENNRRVADFFCDQCKNEYELKSKDGEIKHKIADGAYNTFIQRITSNNNPDFLIMSYNSDGFYVNNLWIIPKHFFTPAIVEKRKPLSANARRAGWVGCNILFDEVPQQGRISIVNERVPVDKSIVLNRVSLSSQLATNNLDARGWLFDVLNCVNRIPSDVFVLDEIYQFDQELRRRHPQNNNIRPKIRQQLQVLRDKGFLEFLGRGQYRKKV